MNEELRHLIEKYKRAPDSRLFAPLADAYRKNGEVDMAIEILEKGIERIPDYASAHVILGKCYNDKGATELARAAFGRVLDIDPENMVALGYLGTIFLAEDRRAEAVECFSRLRAIDPTNEDASLALRQMEEPFVGREIDLGSGKPAMEERPRELATMTLAGIYAAQGYYSKALAIYRDVLEREPGNREAQEMAGRLQSIMDSTEVERDRAFPGEILSISLDEVGGDIATSTAGRGGSAAVRSDITPEPSVEREAEEGTGGDLPRGREPGASAEPAPPAEPLPEAAGVPRERPAEGDLENFRSWLKKMSGR